MYIPRWLAGTTRDRSPVTQGKRKAVPSGIRVKPRKMSPPCVARPVQPRPTANKTRPSRESRASPSNSTMRPSNSERTTTPMPPRYMTK